MMHETLDERGAPPNDLVAHLGACTRCADHLGRLRAARDAVRAAVSAPVPGARLHEAVERARARAASEGPRGTALTPAPFDGAQDRLSQREREFRPAVWVGAALGFALVTFALGAWAGSAAWPREVTIVRTEVRPEYMYRVVEKRVEVPVPVVEVRERVVVRTVRVPVPARARDEGGHSRDSLVLANKPEVLAALPITGQLFRLPHLAEPVISQEVLPAAIATPTPPPDSLPPASGQADLPYPDSRRDVAVALDWGTPPRDSAPPLANGQEAAR